MGDATHDAEPRLASHLPSETLIAGQYRLGPTIGQGAMGQVYAATDVDAHRDVAVKVPHLDEERPEDNPACFLTEAQWIRQVAHPNVVSIIDFGVDRRLRLPFIVMPRIAGHTLRQTIDEEGPLPTRRALRLGAQLARALAACHARNLLHRDVKPDNVLLSHAGGTDEHVTLIDFGLARRLDEAATFETFVGTLPYMSREQATGGPVDGRTDLFSLGCVLYELLAGERPFAPRANMLRFSSLSAGVPPSVSLDGSPTIARRVQQLCSALLQPDARHRPASADAVAAFIDSLLIAIGEGETVAAEPRRAAA